MKKFISVLALLSTLAIAQDAPAQQPSIFGSFLPFILMFVVMYMFFILPKQRENKRTEQMRSALKKGDKVLTMAGIIGVVSHVDERFVCIKTGDTKIDFERAAVVKLLQADSEKQETEKK